MENTEFEEECINKCKVFFYGVLLIHLNRVVYIWYKKYSYKLWTGKMVIILDGFDEISPYYTPKVSILMRARGDKRASWILVSSCFSHWQKLEDILLKLAFMLQPFTLENQIEFL
jgi:hypothetical protein